MKRIYLREFSIISSSTVTATAASRLKCNELMINISSWSISRSSILFLKSQFSSTSTSTTSSTSEDRIKTKKKILFLGTPSFSINVLKKLLQSSEEFNYVICGIVTKPPNKKYHSPIHLYGKEVNLPVYTPAKISDQEFLDIMQQHQPDLCITAAYGNYLPIKFLKIPKYGTINIHPSILPKYRGASPVQRSLVNGDETVGVTVLYTIKEMDAGPIITQSLLQLQGNEKSMEVLNVLFDIGTNDLIQSLHKIFSSIPPPPTPTNHNHSHNNSLHLQDSSLGTPQDHSLATQAPKIHPSEGNVDFDNMTATQIHNLSRGLSEWPGVWCLFHIQSPSRDEYVRVRIVTTRILSLTSSPSSLSSHSSAILSIPSSPSSSPSSSSSSFSSSSSTTSTSPQESSTCLSNGVVYYSIPGTKNGYLEVLCCDNSRLAILELQPQGKRVMTAKAFNNGLKQKKVYWYPILEIENKDHRSHEQENE